MRAKAAVLTLLAGLALAAPFAPARAEAPAQTAPAGTGSARTPAEAEERRALLEALKAAPDEASGRAAENAVWEFWMRVTDDATRALVRDAMAARDGYDWDRALELLNEAVAQAPGYAEVWNQRAFIWFLKEDYEKSLADIDRALELEPSHFGALAGRAHNFFRQGRQTLAFEALKDAVAIHPWLKERHMLPPGERPKPEDDQRDL